MVRALAHEGGQGLGGLRVGEVPAVGGDAVLQVARIGAAAEHLRVVIALEREDARIRQQLHGARRQHARIGGVADRVTRA